MGQKYIYQKETCPAAQISPKLREVNPICLDILYKRGIRSSEDMENFLFPDLLHDLQKHPPLLDTEKAVEILQRAVREKQKVVVYHDYDADDITAGAVALSALRKLGVPTGRYCNDRAVDGFGLCAAGIDQCMRQNPDAKILLTVDNGITGLSGVEQAKQHGLSIIVTDHHEPDPILPPADAILDHKRTDEPETQDKNCCGAGVVWKLMLALYRHLGENASFLLDLLDIVALGTVADIVPLVGDNRAIVQEGLKRINEGKRPFFRMVKQQLNLQDVDTQVIGFQIAPMLNAVSRMGYDPGEVVDLLLTEDEALLQTGIQRLDENNQARRAESSLEIDLALDSLPPQIQKAALVIRDERFQEGIIGIVAGQLKERYHLPCAVFARSKDGNWKGSCRGPSGFHIKKSLDQCAEYLLYYGGHEKAAGLTVSDANFEAFQKKWEELAMGSSQNGLFYEPKTIDLVLPAASFTKQVVDDLRILEPCGEGFPSPLFGLVAHVADVRFMGQEKQHIKYVDDTGLSIIRWNAGEAARNRGKFPSKFVGVPRLNTWNGFTSVQFVCD